MWPRWDAVGTGQAQETSGEGADGADGFIGVTARPPASSMSVTVFVFCFSPVREMGMPGRGGLSAFHWCIGSWGTGGRLKVEG